MNGRAGDENEKNIKEIFAKPNAIPWALICSWCWRNASVKKTKGTKVTDKIISVKEVQKAPRGRKAIFIDGLCEKLGKLGKDEAIQLTETFGEVTVNERAKVNATIRKHWTKVRNDKVSIFYTENGVPQVQARA